MCELQRTVISSYENVHNFRWKMANIFLNGSSEWLIQDIEWWMLENFALWKLKNFQGYYKLSDLIWTSCVLLTLHQIFFTSYNGELIVFQWELNLPPFLWPYLAVKLVFQSVTLLHKSNDQIVNNDVSMLVFGSLFVISDYANLEKKP